MGVLTRGCIALVFALGFPPLAGALPEAQRASAPELTAAFVLNFIKFTTWPVAALPDGAPLVVCFGGDHRVARAFEELTRNRTVSAHPISILQTNADPAPEGCHVVYCAGLDRRRSERLIREASARPVLTLSDSSDFALRGGVANFFIDNGRMRFAVNPHAADRAQLLISSRLLSLARIVPDTSR